MGRHKSKNDTPFPIQMLLVAGAIVFCVWVIQHELPLLLFVGTIVGLSLVAVKFILPTRRRQAILQKADAAIQNHADQLARRRAQLVRQDPYGKPIFDKWLAEIEHFSTHHIRTALSPSERSMFDVHQTEFAPLIATRIEQLIPRKVAFGTFLPSMRPWEFEAFCAEQLQRVGWNAQVTQASRDQGVDVVAQKGRLRVVLQCKLYSSPVGNKAVQEIVAGRTHEQANYGAVVTNNTYTTPAEELAATNGILLLHYSDLPQLETLLKGSPCAQ